MRGKPWSHEEEGELMRLVKAGGDLGLIAGKLGKSVESVKQKMRRLGLVVGTRPPRCADYYFSKDCVAGGVAYGGGDFEEAGGCSGHGC